MPSSLTSLAVLCAVACAPWVSTGCSSTTSSSAGSDGGDASPTTEGGSSSGGTSSSSGVGSSGGSSGSQGDDAGDGSSSGPAPSDGAVDGADATVSSSGSSGAVDGSTDGGDATVSSSSGGDAGDATASSSSSGSCGGGASDAGDAGADAGDATPGDSGSEGGGDGGDAGRTCGAYTVPLCGVTDAGVDLPCDLHDNICCLTFSLVGRCLPKNGSQGTCTSDEVNVGCAEACECPGSQVCCAVQNGLSYSTSCQAVAPGGHCQPYPQTCNTASAQLCGSGSECVGNEGCIPQTCILGANLNICGIQSEEPFSCSQRDAAVE